MSRCTSPLRAAYASLGRIYTARSADPTTVKDKWDKVSKKDMVIASLLGGFLSAILGSVLIYLGSEGLDASCNYGFFGKVLVTGASDLAIIFGAGYICAGGILIYAHLKKEKKESEKLAVTTITGWEAYKNEIASINRELRHNEVHVRGGRYDINL